MPWIFLVAASPNVVVHKMLISDGSRGVVVVVDDYKSNCPSLHHFDGVNVQFGVWIPDILQGWSNDWSLAVGLQPFMFHLMNPRLVDLVVPFQVLADNNS